MGGASGWRGGPGMTGAAAPAAAPDGGRTACRSAEYCAKSAPAGAPAAELPSCGACAHATEGVHDDTRTEPTIDHDGVPKSLCCCQEFVPPRGTLEAGLLSGRLVCLRRISVNSSHAAQRIAALVPAA